MERTIRPIAHIHTDFPDKFGIPRQPGLVGELEGKIIFEPEFRVPDALRGIDGYSHLWLIWDFSESDHESWSPTVRPPHLGGNKRMGVFATRSPNRPNCLGLSLVRLLRVEESAGEGAVLIVAGADMMDGSPIYDIKPYLPYVESIPEANGGFTEKDEFSELEVEMSDEALGDFPEEKRAALRGVLAQDPRPHYHSDPERIYGCSFAGYNVKFRVNGNVLSVIGTEKI